MQSITTHTGRAVVLRHSNVDTDQIIPASFLKRVSRTGFEDGLFAAWRSDPDFVLNQPHATGASILVTGADFGTGSSREHAVWALQDFGFRVVVSQRFGDIFRSNAGKSGLLAAEVDAMDVAALCARLDRDPHAVVTVDLHQRSVTLGDGPDRIESSFDIDDYTRWRLLEGLDEVEVTLSHVEQIQEYESQRPSWRPATLPARTDAGVRS